MEQGGYTTSPAELKERIAAERRGVPFLVYRDGAAAQRIVELGQAKEAITIGRSPRADVSLHWDGDVSRAHAEMHQIADVWTIVDDGLSRNGTFVNDERVQGRRRLTNGDRLRCGTTLITYWSPAEAASVSTAVAPEQAALRISPAQRRVLIALARPFRDGDHFATAATNPQIAAELYLSVPAVKAHIRALFQQFGVGDLPQNQKRARLVALALQSGQITERDLEPKG
jgi:pSer/pThr/pTyr-binding forkhead associated (FHA) protein/DNA-binding CsgD family transcriptional regulator